MFGHLAITVYGSSLQYQVNHHQKESGFNMKTLKNTTGILLFLIANAFSMPQEARSRRELLADNPTSPEDGNNAVLPRGIDSDSSILVKKAELVCEIVNVVTTVGCHYWPTHASTWNGMSNWVVASFKGSTFQNYDCFLYGETVGGIK